MGLKLNQRDVSMVGSSFYPGASNWITRLKAGQGLRLEREPNNKFDKNAIAVFTFQQQLGYLPRGFAAEVAQWVDLGFKITAKKSAKFPGTGVLTVEWETSDDAAANP